MEVDLLPRLADQYSSQLERRCVEVRKETEEKTEAFEAAIAIVDDIDNEQADEANTFERGANAKEKIARDNLAFFEANGYALLGERFPAFLERVNSKMLALYPKADGPIRLPQELSEKDRALLAHGFVRELGDDLQVPDLFEVPGFQLRQFDAS